MMQQLFDRHKYQIDHQAQDYSGLVVALFMYTEFTNFFRFEVSKTCHDETFQISTGIPYCLEQQSLGSGELEGIAFAGKRRIFHCRCMENA